MLEALSTTSGSLENVYGRMFDKLNIKIESSNTAIAKNLKI